MGVLTIIELMRMTPMELTDLLMRITNMVPDFPEGSDEREIAPIGYHLVLCLTPSIRRAQAHKTIKSLISFRLPTCTSTCVSFCTGSAGNQQNRYSS
jgi:hypothetical protein